MVLAFFIYKMVFDNKIDCKNCYDNYMYNNGNAGQVLVFEAYDITAKLDMIYANTTYGILQSSTFRWAPKITCRKSPKRIKNSNQIDLYI